MEGPSGYQTSDPQAGLQKRIILALTLSFLVLFLWQNFAVKPPPKPPDNGGADVAEKAKGPALPGKGIGEAPGKAPGKAIVEAPGKAVPPAGVPDEPAPPPAQQIATFPERSVILRNEHVELTLSSVGAGIRMARLLDFWDSAETGRLKDPEHQLVLFDLPPGVPPAGALSLPGKDVPDLETASWEVVAEEEGRSVTFAVTWAETTIEKTIALEQGRRHAAVTVAMTGSLRPYRVGGPLGVTQDEGGAQVEALKAHFGQVGADGAILAEAQAIEGEDRVQIPVTGRLVWGSVSRIYFAAILRACAEGELVIPAHIAGAALDVWADPEKARPILAAFAAQRGLQSPDQLSDAQRQEALKKVGRIGRTMLIAQVQPDEKELRHDYELYLGPKDPDVLAEYGPLNYGQVIKYSYFVAPAILVRLFLAMLKGLYSVFGDYGFAIVVLTLLVKLALHPLNRKNQKAMQVYQKKMQAIQPEIEQIKARYKNNRVKMQKEMSRVMQEHGVSPQQMLGGCLLMLLQMPIWVALIAVFRLAIEIRQAPAFFGLITDLSLPDRAFTFASPLPLLGQYLNLLPVLYVVLTLIQQKLMPKPKDEQARQQQKMMSFMMIFFGFIFYGFASGLLLYFLTSSTLGIVEQRIIRAELAAEEEKAESQTSPAPKKSSGPKKKARARKGAPVRRAGAVRPGPEGRPGTFPLFEQRRRVVVTMGMPHSATDRDDAPDTIVGISSPGGGAPRGIIRLSGPAACSLFEKVFCVRNGAVPAGSGAWGALTGTVVGPENTSAPARGLLMRAPRSYTREDVVEIHTVGAPPLLDHIAQALVAAGARTAEAGEFTLRAFMNGRIDLAQAEAVSALIAATESTAYRRAQRALAGGVGQTIGRVREELFSLRAELEAELNWPEEEDVRLRSRDETGQVLRQARATLSRLEGPRVHAGREVRVALAGRANAGKSTLFNALLGRERALVHGTPGTTTDAVTAALSVGGITGETTGVFSTTVILVDTAGTGVTAGPVHAAAGAARSRAVEQADIVVGVVDVNAPDARAAVAELREDVRLRCVVGAKADLFGGAAGPPDVLLVSAHTGHGLETLRADLEAIVAEQVAEGGELVSTRQKECVDRALASLERAEHEQARRELCALELREAEEALAEVLGEGVEQDLLAAIFGRFCIGK